MPRPAPNPWVAKNPGPFRVGDRVRFVMSFREVIGEVIEDLACIGPGGERAYDVLWKPDESEGLVVPLVPLLVSEMELVERAAPSKNGRPLPLNEDESEA